MHKTVPFLLLALGVAGVARAQDSVVVIDPDAAQADTADRQGLSEEVVQRLLALYNDSATTRLWGDVDLTRDARLVGRIAVYRGSVRLAGTVEGSLIVINGSVQLLPGATITGDVLVTGGRLDVAVGAQVGGRTEVYWYAAPVVRSAEGVLVRRESRRLPNLTTAQRSFQAGPLRTTIMLGTEGTYNRIEGLPIVFGPGLEYRFDRTASLRLDARGILRSAADDDRLREDFGYFGRLELRLNGNRGFGIGARLHSQVAEIEDHPLTRSEVGWSAFLFQRDQWDYFLKKGLGGYIYGYPRRGLRLELGLRRDKELSVRANDPWSLFRNSDRWRPNPLIDDGHYLTAAASVEADTRNDPTVPVSGWWVRLKFERSWSDDVAPITLPHTIRNDIPTGDYAFNRVEFDLRRYSRLFSNIRVAGRLYGAGYAGGDPLPIQRRVSLGGPGFLPGYAFRSVNCTPPGFNDPSRLALCDRMLAAQLEFRSRIDVGLGMRYQDRGRGEVDRFIGIDEADVVVLLDAGKAWLSGDGPGRVPNNRIPNLSEWKADIGIGVDAGSVGVYLARALTDGEPLRLNVRLKRRF